MRKRYQSKEHKSNHKFEIVRGQELLVRVPLRMAEVWAEMPGPQRTLHMSHPQRVEESDDQSGSVAPQGRDAAAPSAEPGQGGADGAWVAGFRRDSRIRSPTYEFVSLWKTA